MARTGATGSGTDSNAVHITGNESVAGTKTFSSPIKAPDGTAAAPSITPTTQTDMGMYRAGSNILGLASAGTTGLQMSATTFNIQSTRLLNALGGSFFSNRFRLGAFFPQVYDAKADGDPTLAADITTTGALTFTVDDATLFENNQLPRTMWINSERVVATSIAGNVVTCVRGKLGSTASTHTTGDVVYDYNPFSTPFDNWLVGTNSVVTNCSADVLSANITVWLPPAATVGTLTAAGDGATYVVAFKDMRGFTVTFKEAAGGTTIATLTGTSGTPAALMMQYSSSALIFVPLADYYR